MLTHPSSSGRKLPKEDFDQHKLLRLIKCGFIGTQPLKHCKFHREFVLQRENYSSLAKVKLLVLMPWEKLFQFFPSLYYLFCNFILFNVINFNTELKTEIKTQPYFFQKIFTDQYFYILLCLSILFQVFCSFFFKCFSGLGLFKKFSLYIEIVRQLQENYILTCTLNI